MVRNVLSGLRDRLDIRDTCLQYFIEHIITHKQCNLITYIQDSIVGVVNIEIEYTQNSTNGVVGVVNIEIEYTQNSRDSVVGVVNIEIEYTQNSTDGVVGVVNIEIEYTQKQEWCSRCGQ